MTGNLQIGDLSVSDGAHCTRQSSLTDRSPIWRFLLKDTQITDAGLAHLEGLTKLSGLFVSSTQVSDAGLAHLKRLTKLTSLGLRQTQVTDGGVNQLKQVLPSLSIDR